jgi:iron complex transport system substrate-binding protein
VVPRYLRGIYRELRDHPVCDPVIVRNLVDSLLRELTRRHRSASLGAPRPLLDARAYLDAHFAEPIRLADLARRAGYSVSHFSALFKAHFGTSPIDYLVRLRLRAAAYLLRDVNVSVSSAAASVGYDDLYYFSKLFKKKLGVSPRAYRKKLRGG